MPCTLGWAPRGTHVLKGEELWMRLGPNDRLCGLGPKSLHTCVACPFWAVGAGLVGTGAGAGAGVTSVGLGLTFRPSLIFLLKMY